MAIYRLEIAKRFGKYHLKFAQNLQGTDEKTYEGLEDAVGFLRKEIAALDLESDSVIFRGIAYASLNEVERAVKNAPY